MNTQNLIKRTLAQPESVTTILMILEENKELSRSAISVQVCERFDLFNARGKPQRAGCMKALRELERAGHIVLPTARRCPVTISPKRLKEPVETPRDVPAQVGEVCGLRLFKVETDAHKRIWNELMLCEHPRGAGPLVGAQMRYLIGSEHGWLGGLGFGASALQLKDRDCWIGWDGRTRQKHLHRVIGLSRFLIRPSVHCRNLASQVLGMALRQLPADIETRYGYRPWLAETFVETDRFTGACFRAANWVEVGQTRGRGRQDRENQCAQTRKAIYLYPLETDFRTRLGIAHEAVDETLEITEGLEGEGWADNEFGGAQLGDLRLSKRLVESAAIQAQTPGRAFSGAAQGDWSRVKGYYRMIDQPDDGALTMKAILAPHRERTLARMRAQKTVLCIQDGTDLNYSSLSQCEGLGIIGTNQTSAKSRGLHLHSTLAVSTDGLPLGVLSAQCRAPEPKSKQPAHTLPIEQKKGFCWIKSLRDSNALAREMPDTRQVCVMDREADFFELHDEPRHRRVDLLVRAKHDRRIKGKGKLKLFDALNRSPVRADFSISIPRQSSRPKLSKQKARPKREARTAKVALRYRQVTVFPPTQHKDKAPIELWVIHVSEPSPPANEKPLEWFLLTTCDITDNEMARQCVYWYTLRWRIEDWHRVLKSGCGIEELAHKTAERLKRAIAINLVIGWRIMLMTLLGRACPALPAEVLFSDLEVCVLRAYAQKKT
ncbi:MAG: IS4 family transposase [Propionibacteriaceae bacterium]|nr:IS4 family transposase [Propionibacteriaceae bacterium]